MGVKLLGKIKIHELAKKIGLTSKEILEKATKLGIDVKNHMSSVEDDTAVKIEESFKGASKKEAESKASTKSVKEEIKKSDNTSSKDTKKKNEKPSSPVIIRREVIISEEEEARLKEEEERKRREEHKKQVGFVERNTNKDYNIVYRNKPTKPLTVSELFGLKKETKEELKEEKNVETNETIKVDVEAKVEKVKEEPKEIKEEEPKEEMAREPKIQATTKNEETVEKSVKTQYEARPSNRPNNDNRNNNAYNNQGRNFGNNGYNQNRNNNNGFRNNNQSGGYNNQNGGYNNQGRNFGNNQGRNGFNRNGDRNFGQNNQGGFNRNNQNRNGFRNNDGYSKRPLDEKGIEKNIKNIMTDVVEKETVREYNKNIDKQKQNRLEENKAKKAGRQRRQDNGFDEDKLKSLKQRDNLSNMFDDVEGGMLDYYDLTTQRGKKNKKRLNKSDEPRVKQKIFELTEITIEDPITVKDLAAEMKKQAADVIKKLLGYGVLATINNEIDFDTAFLIAGEFGITAKKKETVTEEDILFDDTEDTESELQPRPPVVVVMGHVDHGKTSLLDAVRQTNVIEGEAGGITQHIGAYKVKINDREITFLDTPGHEAFTSMRARGAQVTDIAILVVAANDGVMPQTVEAINHAKAAGIPIIVALNKIDVEGANPEKVKQELMKYELVPEEWGGDTIFVEISAKKKINIDTLLEMVLLVADMKELKANPNKQSKGTVIEARLDKARGPVVSMLVQRGTLDVGDTIVVGSTIGRIRAMTDDKGRKVKKAGPSTPVEITGLTEVPEAGDTFYEVKDEKTAKHLIERRKRTQREKSINATSRVTLNDLFEQIEKGHLKQLNLIVKADVQGSVEAVTQSLEKISNEEVQVKVIHANVGGVTESDVTLAKVSNAIIIAFNVRPDPIAKDVAKKEEVEIKQYSVIYQAIEDVEAAMKGMLDPVYVEKVIGTAEIRQTFKVSSVGTIAGCYVIDGKVARNAGIRVIRDNVVIHDGKLISLKRFKDDAKEVTKGFECGLQIENYNDITEGDTLEVYIMEEVKK